ncbi:MAG: hypothetical protein AB1752_01175 [Candidatus Zixiibacteriota bacterium]
MNPRTDRIALWKRQTRETVAALPSFEFADAPYRVVLNCARPVEDVTENTRNSRIKPAFSLTVNPTEEVTS